MRVVRKAAFIAQYPSITTRMTTNTPLRTRVLLSVQRALLGEISRSVRYIGVAFDEKEIKLRWVFDGPISDEDTESASCVETEIIADMPDHHVVTETIQHDAPKPLAEVRLGDSVFTRHE